MNTRIAVATAIAALGALTIAPQTANASGWVGSGWKVLNTAFPFSVVGSNGQTYATENIGFTTVAESYNTTGSPGGLPTCYEAALLCANVDIIVSPYLCEYATGGIGTITATNEAGGTYYVYNINNNTWSVGSDTGQCPANFPGSAAGSFIYQW